MKSSSITLSDFFKFGSPKNNVALGQSLKS